MNTNNKELYNRNLISTITECLKEHTVELSANNGVVPMYLIEVGLLSSTFQDFIDTYINDVDQFKQKVAQKILGKKSSEQKYGVLVDTNLKYTFAFNRKFADINKTNKKIVFKSVEDVILDASNNADNKPNYTPQNNNFPSSFPFNGGSGNMTMRYSLTGKAPNLENSSNDAVNHDKASLLKNVKNSYNAHKISLKLEDGKLHNMFLINTIYKTSTVNDLVKTYQNDLDDFKLKLALKQFGNLKTTNSYGLLFSDDLQIMLAFNNNFAYYDKKSKSIVYRPVEEVLLENNKRDFSKIMPKSSNELFDTLANLPKTMKRPFRRGGGSTVMRYSLQGKVENN